MEKSRKKLRVCLFCVVLAAVAVGFIYYFSEVRTSRGTDDGVLVTGTGIRWERLWQ